MSKSSFKPGAVEIFYGSCAMIFGGLSLVLLTQWVESLIDSSSPGVPGPIVFLFVFGMVVMGILHSGERSYRRSVKRYDHSPEPVPVK